MRVVKGNRAFQRIKHTLTQKIQSDPEIKDKEMHLGTESTAKETHPASDQLSMNTN